MNIDRKQQRLKYTSSKNAVNTDTLLKIGLNNKERLLPYDDINKLVNVNTRFNEERNKSSFYRIIGTINSTASNALFNLNDSVLGDSFTYSIFNNILFLDTSYPKDNDVADKTDLLYSTALKSKLIEKDGWFGYLDPDITKNSLCYFYDMEPKRERFSFIPDTFPYHGVPSTSNSVKNWELTITYPSSSDKTHFMVNNGLIIVEAKSVFIATRPMVAFGVACKHNLNIGDVVKISGTTGYNGEHIVIRTGLDNGDLKENYFVLDLRPTGFVGNNSRMKKVINGVNSEYYFRKFKKIKTRNTQIIETDDYETYGLSFSENIYYDSITQYVFNEDINVDGLIDNLGRPLSEIFLTIIKTDSNNLFTDISSGIETPFINQLNNSQYSNFNYLRNIPAINKIHNGGITTTSLPFPSHIPLENKVTINNNNNLVNNDEFYGDLVEYNTSQLKETILADVHHRFNTINRESAPLLASVVGYGLTPSLQTITLGPRQEGYYYKAHHSFKIREFSSYIEQGDQFTENLPSYAVNMGDGRYLWRDLLELGFHETDDKNTIDYPFLNGCHYLYQNHIFHIKRQDPFNQWDLFYTNYPSDPIGQIITQQFTTNSAEDVC